MSIIDKLHELVTPKVLELVSHYTGDTANKTELLSSVYGVLGARLSDSAALDRIEALLKREPEASTNGSKLLDALLQDEKGNPQASLLSSELAKEHDLPESTASAMLATATPMVLDNIKTLAGEGGIVGFLQDKLEDLARHMPAWAVTLLPAGLLASIAGLAGSAGNVISSLTSSAGSAVTGLASGASSFAGKAMSGATHVASGAASTAKDVAGGVVDGGKAAVGAVTDTAKDAAGAVASGVTEAAKKGGGLLKSLLPIIGLVILGVLAWLMLRGCQDNKTPVAAPTITPAASETAAAGTASADVAPATFSLATDEQGNAVYSCRGQAGNEGVFAKIRTTLSGVFGTADKCDLQVSDKHAGELSVNDEQLKGLFGLMKGVPNASMSLDGKTIRFNASNDADIAKLIEGAKGLLPADFVIEAEPKLDAAAAVNNSIDTAKTAIEGLGENTDADDLVRALNLQIINFATSSNAIPEANKEILNLAAVKLVALPDARLKIIGHTDSQGNHAANQKLSERRAAAVRDYLVSQGVPAERLETFGASSDSPIASNATEQGRFQNRRIEFTLVEKDGKVTSVGHAENGKPADTTPKEAPKSEEKAQ